VADSRSPDAIQREIEATRAELADTIDAIADRVSPKKAASRGAQAVKAKASAALGGAERAVTEVAGTVAGKAGDVADEAGHNGSDPAVAARQTEDADSGRIQPREPTVLSSTGETIANGRPASVLDARPDEAAHADEWHVANLRQRSLRTDRVLITIGVTAAAVGAVVLLRNRHN
jgi:hypothetical protein